MLLKVPDPLVLQLAELAPPPKLPFIVAVVFEQIVWAVPALTVGRGFTVIVRVAVAGEHGDAAFVVRVRTMLPLKFAAGVNVTVEGLLVFAVLLNVPLPLVMLHAPVVALPPILAPVSVMAVGVADWQTTSGPPALAVGS